MAAACATPLTFTPPASAQTIGAAKSPALPATLSTGWTGNSAAPSNGTDRTGVILAALPAQGLAAFELGKVKDSSTPQIVERLQRTGNAPLAPLADNFKYTDANAFTSSSSAFGTLIAYQSGFFNGATAAGRILRPDGGWENLTKIGSPTFDFGTYAGHLLSQATITDDGSVFYTEALDNNATIKIYDSVSGKRDLPASATISPQAPAVAPVRTTKTTNGTALAFTTLQSKKAVWLYARDATKTSWTGTSGNGIPLPDGVITPNDTRFADATSLASGPDGWAYATFMTLRVFSSGAVYGSALHLLRRAPDGTTDIIELYSFANLENQVRVRVLPGTGGAATVLYGGWRVADGGSGSQYALTSHEVNALGERSQPEILMEGPLGQFDAYVAPDGKQSVLWERVEAETLVGTARWKAGVTTPAPDSVAYQSRASASSAWGTPQLLSTTARSYNLDNGVRLEPRLQPSGNALYAGWYENRADGTAAGLQTAVTGYIAPTSTPAPTVTPAPGATATPAATAKPTPAPAATPAPAGSPARPVTQTAAGSRRLNLSLLLRPRRAPRACPSPETISIRVRKPRVNGRLSSRTLPITNPQLAVKAVTSGCQVTGTVELRTALPAGRTVGVVVSAAGFRVRAPRVTLK